MPELPEVETVVRGLEKAMRGQTIESVTLNRRDLRFPFPPALGKIRAVKVKGLRRRAKYILIDLADGRTMIVHLGMSGRMTVADADADAHAHAPEKHDHMILNMRGGRNIVFNDPRRSGLVDLAGTEGLERHKLFRHLGPEPFDPVFGGAHLAEKFRNKKTAVKQAVMDQRIVVGVGNIYASEALYCAGIDPRRAAGSLNAGECGRLAKAVKDVLARAVRAGGSSLRDYVRADGELGYFQRQWAVYGRGGQCCKSCKTPCVVKITQGGRSTFYCPRRQK
jgi:formamidopyrimidine-DNA glycosylase